MIFVHSEDSAPTCLLCVEEDSVTEYSKLSSDQVGSCYCGNHACDGGTLRSGLHELSNFGWTLNFSVFSLDSLCIIVTVL